MAVSPRKVSKARKRIRRSHHAMTATQYSKCDACGAPKMPHRICLECGSYAGRQVLTAGEEPTKEAAAE